MTRLTPTTLADTKGCHGWFRFRWFLVSHGIIWYLWICFETWYSYMIVFPGFRQYKCKKWKKWKKNVKLKNLCVGCPCKTHMFASLNFHNLHFLSPIAPNGGYSMCCVNGGNHSFLSKCCVFWMYVECVLGMFFHMI